MEFNYMPTAIITIVVIGILIGVGVILLDQFGVAVKTSASPVNETIAIASSGGTLANDDVTAVTYFGNDTSGFSTDGKYAFDVEVNWTRNGTVYVGGNFTDNDYDISYTYDADSHGTTAVFSARDATDDFVTWLPVIIIIIATAIILTLVTRSFRQ